MQTLLTHDVQAYSAQWARALLHERFTATMADLIGPNVQLHHTKLFQKPPETGGAFPMHQDCPYFPHEKHSMMACTIHLTDTDEQMGCLRVWPGSHKLGPLPVHKEPHGGLQYQYLDPAEYPIDRATACPAQRGDVLFFSYLTIHGSDLNRSDRVQAHCRPHAEESFGGTGITMPSSSYGVDDPFSYCQDKIISHEVREYVDNPVIVQQGIERIGVIVEEGNHVLPFIARLGFRSPASRQFHGGVEGVGNHRHLPG